MAYGSPATEEGILPYYTHMRGGRPPRPDALEELKSRYRAIGGHSPLSEITRAQASGLERILRSEAGADWRVTVGMKHTQPFIEDAVQELAAAGVESVIGLVLAPHYSRMSVAGYVDRARTAAEGTRLRPSFIEDWHLDIGYLDWLAQAVESQLRSLGPERSPTAQVIFTAHSLPARLREMGDPYPDQLGETAAAVAARLELPNWTVGWQSVAQDAGEPWLGPELLAVVRASAERGVKDFVVCPCGFVADHLEILYDLDVDAQDAARRIGVTILRTSMPNDELTFLRVLASLVLKTPNSAR